MQHPGDGDDDFIAPARRAFDRVSDKLRVEGPDSGQFRSDVPAIPPPPDRAQWAREHGQAPRRIVAAERFVTQARRAIERDYSTLSRDEAITQDVKLEGICERVKGEEKLATEGDMVFFDAQDGHFWIYPVRADEGGEQFDVGR